MLAHAIVLPVCLGILWIEPGFELQRHRFQQLEKVRVHVGEVVESLGGLVGVGRDQQQSVVNRLHKAQFDLYFIIVNRSCNQFSS